MCNYCHFNYWSYRISHQLFTTSIIIIIITTIMIFIISITHHRYYYHYLPSEMTLAVITLDIFFITVYIYHNVASVRHTHTILYKKELKFIHLFLSLFHINTSHAISLLYYSFNYLKCIV